MLDFIKNACLASALYVAAFAISMPASNWIADVGSIEFANEAQLIFLPHGVRVLTAWLFGVTAAPMLLPGVCLAFLSITGIDEFSLSHFFAAVLQVSIAPALFLALGAIGFPLGGKGGGRVSWIGVVLIGLIASVLTSSSTNFALGFNPEDFAAYIIGDMSGLFLSMFGLLAFFRLRRRF